EPFVRDRIAADDRDGVRAVLEPGLGLLDGLEGLPRLRPEGVGGVGLLQLVRLIAGVLGLVRSLFFPMPGELLLDASPFLGEALTCVFGVHGVILVAYGRRALAERKRVPLHPRVEDQREPVL